MNNQDKTRDELIKELQKLQHEYDLLKISYEKDITERKQAEKELCESEERYHSLFNAIDEGFCIVEVIFDENEKPVDYRFLEINPSFERQTNLINAQGRRMRELKPKHEESWFEIYGKIAVTGQPLRFQNRAEQLNRWYDVYAFRVGRPKDRHVAILFNDITKRKQTEEMVRESNQKVIEALEFNRKILNTSSIGILIYKESGQCISANKAVAKATGGTVKQLLAQNFHKISSWKKSGMYKAAIKALDSGIVQLLDVHLVTTFGKNVWLSLNFSSFDSANEKHLLVFTSDITRRKQTEEALKMEKENFRHSLDESPLGVRIVTLEGNTIYTNKTLLDFYAYNSLKELQKTPFKDRYTPESYMQAQERKRQREHGDLSATNYEINIVRKNGEIRHLQVFRKEVFWDDVRQFQIIYNDITEHKRTEEMLRKSELKYRNLIEQAPDIIFVVNAEGNLLYVNQTGQKMLGYSKDELCEMKTVNTYPNDEITVGRSRLKEFRAMRAGETMFFERLMRRKDGSLFPVEINIGALEDGTAHAIIRDITEREKAKESLYKSEEKYRNFFENDLSGDYVITLDGKIVMCNHAFAEILGYKTVEEIIDDSDFRWHKTPQERKYFLNQLRKKKKLKMVEQKLQNREGKTIIIMENVIGEFDKYDQLVQIKGYIFEITERKLAEEEVIKSKKLLEDLHRHLEEIRENERAVISREIHDQIGQSLTALKLDMNWMTGYLKNISPEAAAKRQGMIELISNTIKDVQRISSDLRPGILDDLGLSAAIEWYCDEFEKRTGIRCSLKLDNSTFDDSQKNLAFFRVLQEALTNVTRHANASSVTIKLHQTQKGTTMTIHDNGIGIPEEKIESNKSLGLIGMRERINQFGGKVDFSSKKGQGTKLTIFIPEKKISKS